MASVCVDDDLVLHTYTIKDAAALCGLVLSSRQHLRSWISWVDGIRNEADCRQYIEQAIQQLNNQQALITGIFYRGQLIGSIDMHHWEHAIDRAQLGYWLGKQYEGKGIIQKCLTAFISFLFTDIRLNKLEIHFLPGNERSAKVATRLGFKTEGIIRQCCLRNGKAEDIIITGLLKSEWNKNNL